MVHFFFYTRFASEMLHSAILDKVVWSGNAECSKFDLDAVNNGFLMVSHILNGTSHPTFSPPAPIPSSFLQELSFCALAVYTHICSLWMFSACFAVWAVFVPVLFCCTLRSVPQQLTVGCMCSFDCVCAEDAARFPDCFAEHCTLMMDSVVDSQQHQKAENMAFVGLLG